jgi:hypothetical protein
MADQPRRWTLEINADGEAVRGEIADEAGGIRTFSSWIALLAAMHELTVEASREEPRPG